MIISESAPLPSKKVIDRSNPVLAFLKERSPLTADGSSKHTYHASLNIENTGVVFKPGDSIGIFAQNDPTLVNHIIAAMKATGQETIIEPRSQQEMTLFQFLSSRANLSRVTSSFLRLFHEYETGHDKKNQLHRLLQQENKPLLSQYLSSHDPLDLFKEYQDVKAPLQDLCAQFGPLLPRFYSVASSLKAYPNEVHLTVALFTFTHSGEQRFGVASHFLCHLAELNKTPIPIYVQTAPHFALPADSNTPIIMVGPGTGVAPFRAFLQERAASGATGKNWLFFGERNQSSDFFYSDLWQGLVKENKLELDLAFSRDQEEKIYVQHRMLQKSKQLWQWLQDGAFFYVCGDAHRMAKDVEAALVHIAQTEGNLSEDDAKAYIKSLRTQKRYLADVY